MIAGAGEDLSRQDVLSPRLSTESGHLADFPSPQSILSLQYLNNN